MLSLIREEIERLQGVERAVLIGSIRRLCNEFDPPRLRTADTMTAQDARAFGDEIVAFGKHVGMRYRDVPREYLEWLADAKREEWRRLHAYLNSSEQMFNH